MNKPIDWTGERFLPAVGGDIALEHTHRYALAQSLASGKRVLDIACGEGYGSNILAEVATSVLGVDIDVSTVAHARGTYKRANLAFRQGSCTNLDLPDSKFDLIVSFETLEHHAEHDAMLSELRRVLTPNGVLIISTPDRQHYSDELKFNNPHHVRELYASEFYQLIRLHFRFAEFWGQRIAYGSVITPVDRAVTFMSFSSTNSYLLAQAGLEAPLYQIAIASASPLPSLPASIFDATSTHRLELDSLRQDLQVTRDLLAAVHRSAYWRIAEPIRWLRRTLRRIRSLYFAK